jgi:predicted tellurium resistance membrane protein TerC
MLNDLFTLGMLVLLQAVLGFDNLLYISLASKRVAPEKQSFVRKTGVGLAIALRMLLLFALVKAVDYFQTPYQIKWEGIFEGAINLHSLIVLAGGAFIVYTAMKEITHMLSIHDLNEDGDSGQTSVGKIIFLIVVMNLVFSFDSILSAMALTETFWVMAAAIIISGIMMIALADRVAEFLERNRMYEVLGLFILFIVGIMLVSEGGELAHLKLFTHPVEAMSKSTFYFVLVVLILVDIVQGRYQKRIIAQQAIKQGAATESSA